MKRSTIMYTVSTLTEITTHSKSKSTLFEMIYISSFQNNHFDVRNKENCREMERAKSLESKREGTTLTDDVIQSLAATAFCSPRFTLFVEWIHFTMTLFYAPVYLVGCTCNKYTYCEVCVTVYITV